MGSAAKSAARLQEISWGVPEVVLWAQSGGGDGLQLAV